MSEPGMAFAAEPEVMHLRRQIEALRADVFRIASKMDDIIAIKTDVALLNSHMTDLRGNGRDGRVSVIEKELRGHAKLIAIATGAILVLTPITLWLLNQFHLMR